MKVTIKSLFRETNKYEKEPVVFDGWIKTLRASKNFGFIEVNDGTFFKNIQIVFDEKINNFEEVSKLPIYTSLLVHGDIVLTPGAKQSFEIHATEIEIVGTSSSDFPLQKKRHTPEYLRTIAHLRPRTNLYGAAFRVRSLTAFAIHKFFQEKGFVYVNTPIITGSDCEGAGEMFKVTTLDLKNIPKKEDGTIDFKQDFFGKESNLTVSGQLNGEAFALAFRNIYTFGPTFRAENSNTTRHAAEFWMMEPEMAFAELDDIIEISEEMLKYIIQYVIENAPEEMEFFNTFVQKGVLDRLKNVLDSDFGKVTYSEAVELIQKADCDFEYTINWGDDLQTEHERYLTEEVFKKPIYVTDYPKDIKAFYMRMNDDGKTVAATDLLVPGIGEIIGGSQREERLEILIKRMKELGLKEEDYWWYLELRKYGGTKHSGYGLGFERILMYITGISNIRDVIPFPRTPKSSEF